MVVVGGGVFFLPGPAGKGPKGPPNVALMPAAHRTATAEYVNPVGKVNVDTEVNPAEFP